MGIRRELPGRWDDARCEEAAARLAGPGFLWLDGHSGSARSFLAAAPAQTHRVRVGEPALASLGALSRGWWAGYIAYDAAWSADEVAGLGPSRFDRPSDPVVVFHRYEARVVVDLGKETATLEGESVTAVDALAAALKTDLATATGTAARIGSVRSTPRASHARAIEAAKAFIAQGEIYQVNLARTWRAPFAGDALMLWRAMREASPVPLGFYLDAGDHQVCARTMERFLHWDGSRLETRPIKGTLARTGDDQNEALRLRTDPKEHAEHVMIVDLMRNDLGRVAKTGTVKVETPLAVEPFAKLSHLVSTISCETRDDVDIGDIVRATFPPGSITGAPKVRAMQIIEQLEPEPRGVYCGAVGFIDSTGSAPELSLAVTIRTAVVRGGEVIYRAGGGLVSASDIAKEVEETELKARVFLDALESLAD